MGHAFENLRQTRALVAIKGLTVGSELNRLLVHLDRQESLRREWRGYAEQLADEPPRQHDPSTCDIPACPLCQQLARDRATEMDLDLRRGK